MDGERAVLIEFGVREILEAIAEYDDSGAACDLEIEFYMAMAEDIVIAVVLLLLLVFGKEHQFFLVFALVRTGISDLFEPAVFGPFVSELITPTRRKATEAELEEGILEDALEVHEMADFALHVPRVERFPITWEQAVSVAQVERFAVSDDGAWLVMDFRSGHFPQSSEGPEVMVAGEEMDMNALPGQFLQFFAERSILPFGFVVMKILHPEIEHIAEHVDGYGVLAHHLEHVDHFFLMRPATLNGQASQMCVG